MPSVILEADLVELTTDELVVQSLYGVGNDRTSISSPGTVLIDSGNRNLPMIVDAVSVVIRRSARSSSLCRRADST